MRSARLTLAALLVFAASSCSDRGAPQSNSTGNVPPPITGGDGGVFVPPPAPPLTSTPATPSVGLDEPGGNGNGNGNGGNQGGGGPPGSNGGGGGGGGGPAGSAVPEPGTLFLVGSGLAGAAMLRRRRQAKQSSS
jgi:hypothetical protein